MLVLGMKFRDIGKSTKVYMIHRSGKIENISPLDNRNKIQKCYDIFRDLITWMGERIYVPMFIVIFGFVIWVYLSS